MTLEYLATFIASLNSAGIFAYGYKSFISPTIEVEGRLIGSLITGGASGISQIIVKIFEIFGFPVNELAFGSLRWNYFLQSVIYVFVLFLPTGLFFPHLRPLPGQKSHRLQAPAHVPD